MIVERLTYHLKPGHVQEALELLKGVRAKLENPDVMRIYAPNIGPPSTLIVVDIEFEDMATRETVWKEWFAKPEAAEFMEKWPSLIESTTIEIWSLIE